MSIPAVPHRARRLTGRDPHEAHRAATPLELLYDLTFVVAFGIAADEFAHYVADDHTKTAIIGFLFATFAVSWAWINYSWFASAYDEDDWICRLAVMVQMIGVVILALGLEEVFKSIDKGETLDAGVMILGYVVMRVAMIFLWVQAARHDPGRRPAAMTYITTLAVAQVGWVGLALVEWDLNLMYACAAFLIAIEVAGPIVAETRKGGTPWHVHHIVERYGLLVIITLGEGIIGTVASMNAVVHGEEGWTFDAALVAIAGVGLTFGAWWAYFAIPWAQMLEAHRERSFGFGYGHLFVFGGLAAMGGALHVAAYYLEDKAKIDATAVVVSVVVPVFIYLGAIYVLYSALARTFDTFHLLLVAGTIAILALSIILAEAGVSMAGCLMVLMLAPVVTVIGYETVGHRHIAEALE